MMDGIEQKIEKLTVMMGKLVTDNERQNRQLNQESICPTEVEERQDFRTDLGQTTHIGEDQDIVKIIEVGQDIILIIGVTTEVIRGMGDKIIAKTEEEMLGTKTVIIGVCHMISKTEVIAEGTIEASVTVGLGQVQEQVQI